MATSGKEKEYDGVRVGPPVYFGDWKPNPGPNSKYDPDEAPKHHKVATYNVLVNDATQYSWDITTSVTHPYNVEKNVFHCEFPDLEVRMEGQDLVIVKQGEEFGICMKMPKSIDCSATPYVDGLRHTLYVTMPKKGAPGPIKEINMETMKPDWAYPASYYAPGNPGSPEYMDKEYVDKRAKEAKTGKNSSFAPVTRVPGEP
eukprot:5526334-Prymnesium_polylepis.1